MGVVYNTAGGGTGGTTMNLVFNAGGTPTGRSIVVWVTRETGFSDSITFSLLDNKTNAYVPTLSVLGSNGARILMWVCTAAASGTSSLGITASGSPVRWSAGVIECDLLNGTYYDFLEVSNDELAATSTTHQCGPDPGITTGANEVLVLAIGQADGAGTLGTLSLPGGGTYNSAFVGTTLPSVMAAFRTGNTGSGERAVWSHTGSNRRCINAMHALLFATTTAPAYVCIPQALNILTLPRQPAIQFGNRVVQVVGGLTSIAGLTLTLPQPVGNRSSLVVTIGREGSADRTFTVADNGGGTWTQVVNYLGTNFTREAQVSVCLNAVPGTTTITVTASGSGTYSAAVIECERLHATLYDDIRGTDDESTTSLTHRLVRIVPHSTGISTPNNVLMVAIGQAGSTQGTKTPPSGYTLITGTWASTMMAYALKPTGVLQDNGLYTGTGTARQAMGLLQSLMFDGQTGARVTRPPAIGDDYSESYIQCQDPTIINDIPSGPTTLNLPAIALTLGPLAPTWAVSTDLTLPVIPAAFTMRAPLLLAGRNLPLPVVSMTLVPLAPTLLIGRTIQLPALVLLFDAELPSLSAIQQVSPPKIPLTLTPLAPAVQAGTTIRPAVIPLTLQPQAPAHITNDQMLRLAAIPLTLAPQASHIVILVEQLMLPAIALHLTLPPLGKVETGIDPPQFVGMHPLSMQLPMLVNVETSEGPATTRLTNLSMQLPMLSGAEMN